MIILPLHILGGLFALLFGYTALYATKGATLHRKSGMGFVMAMVVMSLTGAFIASLKSDRGSIIAGLLTFYFVITGLLTVVQVPGQKRLERIAMVWAFVVGLSAIWAGWWYSTPAAWACNLVCIETKETR